MDGGATVGDDPVAHIKVFGLRRVDQHRPANAEVGQLLVSISSGQVHLVGACRRPEVLTTTWNGTKTSRRPSGATGLGGGRSSPSGDREGTRPLGDESLSSVQ